MKAELEKKPVKITWLLARAKNRQTQAIVLTSQLLGMWFASAWHLMDWNERAFPYWPIYGGFLGHIVGVLLSTTMLTDSRVNDIVTGSVRLPEAQDKTEEALKED